MPSCMHKKTRFAPGTKRHGPDEVLDVAYLKEVLGSVKVGIQNEKMRVRGLSDHNTKLQTYLKNLKHDEDELLAKLDNLKNEIRREKSRAAWLEQHSKSASESRSMGQNSHGYQPFLQGNHWIPNSYPESQAFSPASYGQASSNYMNHGGYINLSPPPYPMSHGNMFRLQHPPSPLHPPPPNYFPLPHFPPPINPAYMGFPGPQPYSGWMGVPQYGY